MARSHPSPKYSQAQRRRRDRELQEYLTDHSLVPASATPVRDPKTKRFLPGHARLGGMQKGFLYGRRNALLILDRVLSEAEVAETLEAALRRFVMKHPVQAFKQLVMPLLPKGAVMQTLQEDGRASVRIVMSAPMTGEDMSALVGVGEASREKNDESMPE